METTTGLATQDVPANGQELADFRIIGIGASAGGLEALKSFFDQVPSGCPHSFVVIQHLSPDYKSMMADLLSKSTDLQILQVKDQMKIQPSSIYLIPPKMNMTIKARTLYLSEKPPGHLLPLPIDVFFHSLAAEQAEASIAVILTGTGSDGTSGVRAIKDVSGLVMVQSPEEAKFDGMPRSAIQTGLVDIVAPVADLPAELFSFLARPSSIDPSLAHIEGDEETLQRILRIVRDETEVDFSTYKRPTLARRLDRRMALTKCDTLQEYHAYLLKNNEEARILHRDFLIGVTRFFRDPKVWDKLKSKVLPALVKNRTANRIPIRLWSVACSTGEEVYTLAIMIKEEMRRQDRFVDVKIFATDIDKTALGVASQGLYPESIMADVDTAFLSRYFVRKGDTFQVTKELRSMVIFSHHNILKDPPFNRLDLVSCRNMLIYFQQAAQHRTLRVLHYSLNLGGHLLLGPSENPGELKNGFEEVDRQSRLYRNILESKVLGLEQPTSRLGSYIRPSAATPKNREFYMADALNEATTKALGMAGVFVDEHFDIHHAHGRIRDFIALPESGFSSNLIKLLPNDVAIGVSSAARRAKADQEDVHFKGARIKIEDKVMEFNILVRPLDTTKRWPSLFFLILFIPRAIRELKALQEEANQPLSLYAHRVDELEQELMHTRESLQAMMEEAETANEELQATNEELLAANEELQSTNEELQSMNEELHSVNAEYQQKIEETLALNADMDNLLKSTEIGTLFLDRDMQIRRFTPAILQEFNLLTKDIGRPLSHFTSKFNPTDNLALLESAELVLKTKKSYNKQMLALNGVWYLVKITPFQPEEGKVDGVVISFIDITDQKEIELRYAHQNLAFQQVLEGTMAGYWDWRIQDDTEYLSPTFKKMFGYRDDEMENSPESWQRIIHPEDLPKVMEIFRKHVESKGHYPYDTVIRYFHKNGNIVWVFCRGKVIEWDDEGNPVRMVGSHVDVTELKSVQHELERSNLDLKQFAYIASHDLQEPLRTISSFGELLSLEYSDALDDDGKTYLKFMFEASERMSRLITGLLNYSRLGRDWDQKTVSIEDVLQYVKLDMMARLAETDSVLTWGPMPTVYGNELALARLLHNLISNAIKFRQKDHPSLIHVEAKEDASKWTIYVHDQGIGIEERFQERIFQIFQRLHTHATYEGTGIGLAECKKIVELHNGEIGVTSTLDKGSTFFFSLPKSLDEYNSFEEAA